jgi:hypothetical protein
MCPLDNDPTEIVALAYPHHPDADLWIQHGGCSYVTNGAIISTRP